MICDLNKRKTFSRSSFLFAFFLFTFAGTVNAQWTASSKEFNSEVSAVAVSAGGTIYVSTTMDAAYDDNLFSSADGGVTWKTISPKFPYGYPKYLFIASAADGGQYLFACTQYSIYRLKLATAGAEWVENHDIIGEVSSMCQVKKYGKSIYATARGSGLFRTDDNGDHWVRQTYALVDDYNPVIFGQFVTTDTNFYVQTNHGLCVSTDAQHADYASGDRSALTFLAKSGKTFFTYSFSQGMLASTDGGATWTPMGKGLEQCKSVSAMCSTKTETVFAATDHGVFMFDKTTQTWKDESTGLTDTYVWQLVPTGTKLITTSGKKIYTRLLTGMK
ncbi:MAG TPA: hypothetical protein VL651_02265 [Bacteroidia bacterium]|nr:hypothetical protein [Bacteroidia bacterium]